MTKWLDERWLMDKRCFGHGWMGRFDVYQMDNDMDICWMDKEMLDVCMNGQMVQSVDGIIDR